MGQQQLLLVILVTIIVGIATVVAINTFSSAAEGATMDAVRQDLASIAASAQGYYMKPTMLGGGGNEFTGITFDNMAFGGQIGSSTLASNENGTYRIGTISAGNFVVNATPNIGADSAANIIPALICPDDMVMGTPGGSAPTTCP